MPRINALGGTLARTGGLALAYLTAALLGIDLSREAGNVAVFWPANALLVGALLRIDPRERPLILTACAIACAAAYMSMAMPWAWPARWRQPTCWTYGAAIG